MNSLQDAFDIVGSQKKKLEVYTADRTVASETKAQFSTRNVQVTSHQLPSAVEDGYILIRDDNDDFQGALGIDTLQAIISPEIHPPWALSDSEVDLTELFNFLNNLIFSSYNRRQLLAIAREIEERAWRTNAGTLYTGFQNSTAFTAQTPVYNRFARERNIAIQIFIENEWETELADTIEVVSDAGDEIGQFWFVIFDGAGSELEQCGMLAKQNDPDHYFGFWTHDPDLITEIISYLHSTYGPQ
jgi:hypothetical protein